MVGNGNAVAILPLKFLIKPLIAQFTACHLNRATMLLLPCRNVKVLDGQGHTESLA